MRKMGKDGQRCEPHHSGGKIGVHFIKPQRHGRIERGSGGRGGKRRDADHHLVCDRPYLAHSRQDMLCERAQNCRLLIIISYFINLSFLLKFSWRNPQLYDMRWECLDTFPIVIFRSASRASTTSVKQE